SNRCGRRRLRSDRSCWHGCVITSSVSSALESQSVAHLSIGVAADPSGCRRGFPVLSDGTRDIRRVLSPRTLSSLAQEWELGCQRAECCALLGCQRAAASACED